MKYKLYTTSQKAWDGMYKAMSLAQKSIYLEMYIFLNDTQATHNFWSLLKEKAKAGLEVVIITDAFGSANLKEVDVKELREADVEFIYFSRWFRRLHRKILIIDNKVAFIGGVNIKENIRHWVDLQMKIQGKIVQPLLQSFAYAYKMVGGKKDSILKYSRLPLSQKIKSWVADNFGLPNKRYHLNNYYRERIVASRSSIQIVTPYLLPPRWLIALLDQAAHRGVKVEMIIPSDTDIKSLNKINFLNSCRLSALGVTFYMMPRMNHAKIMLIDLEEGIIGSQNMDILSFNLNMEAGVFFRQRDLVMDLSRIIEHWKKESILFVSPGKKLRWYDRFLIMIFKFFYPIF